MVVNLLEVYDGPTEASRGRAAATVAPDKRARSVHTLFARAGDIGRPLEISLQVLHNGRTTAATQVTVRQGDRTICGALVLLDSPEDDVFRAAPPMPAVSGPEGLPSWPDWEVPGAHVRPVDDVDLYSTEATGPAEVRVWVRWDDPGPADQAVHQVWWRGSPTRS